MKYILVGTIVFVAEILAVVALYFVLNGNLDESRKIVSTNNAQLSKYGYDSSDTISNDLEVIEAQLTLLERLEKTHGNFAELVNGITASMPNRVWFSSIQTSDRKVYLNGFALDHRAITKLSDQLEQNLSLTAELQSARDVELFGVQLLSFELSCE